MLYRKCEEGRALLRGAVVLAAGTVWFGGFACAVEGPQEARQAVSRSANVDDPSLMWKGLNMDFPPPSATVTPSMGGLRDELAEKGIGVFTYALLRVGDNLNGGAASSGPPRGTQTYFGQEPTYLFGLQGTVLIDLQRHGVENGQIAIGAEAIKTDWEPAGPTSLSLSTLSYYQTFADKRLELKAGYLDNNYEFYGPYVGGNLASNIFGSSSSIPSSNGLSITMAVRPGVNLQYNIGNFYNKFGVQKSTSPDGYVRNNDDNPNGFKWNVPHAKELYINEFGFKRAPKMGQSKAWYRLGFMRNTSEYNDLKNGGRGNGQHAAYLMGDQQLYQIGNGGRGAYGGFSLHVGDDQYSRIDRTYEMRLYAIGPFDSRPADMFSFTTTYQHFSDHAVDNARRSGSLTHAGSLSSTLAYNALVSRGIRAGLGVSYINHPSPISYDEDTGSGLLLLSNLIFYF
jgi:porin